MRSWVDRGLLRISAVAVVLLTGPMLLSGCGGGGADTSGGQIAPEDPAQAEARSKAMEDYMNSAEGKKATRGPK